MTDKHKYDSGFGDYTHLTSVNTSLKPPLPSLLNSFRIHFLENPPHSIPTCKLKQLQIYGYYTSSNLYTLPPHKEDGTCYVESSTQLCIHATDEEISTCAKSGILDQTRQG